MTVTATGFQQLPLERLHESALNPRKTFDQAKMADLIASVKAKGVITPLLVRPNASGFEIAAGHRRFRAAKAAGLADVPAVVRPMDDTTFLEVLIMENDEREDLHPLEEAEGYRTLMTRAGYSVERIAERRGCSVKYVYDRVKLLALIPEAQKLFREGKFTAGHAILLARLSPKDQKRAIDPDRGGLFQHEQLLWDPDEEGRAPDPMKARSVRELEAWIDEHVRFDPKAADPMLFGDTLATVSAAQAEAEKVVKITHEHFVRPEARDDTERTYGPMSWKRADGKRKSKPCEHAVTGVVVIGPGRGEAFKVCTEKKKCKVHWSEEQRQAKRRQNAAPSREQAQDRWKREEERRKAEEAREEAERARWKKATPAILDAIAAAVKRAPAKATGLLASIILDEVRGYNAPKTSGDYVPLGKTAEDLVRHAAFVVLHTEATEWRAFREFPKRAKALGIDVRKMLDAAAPAAKPAART